MWKSKLLHGQFLSDISDTVDHNFQWGCLSSSNFKKETEGFITTNLLKIRIFHQPGSVNCHLCVSHDEIVDHLLTSCNVIA